MPTKIPLLVLACSETKAPIAAGVRVPFADLYTGPMWLQVKASGFPLSNVAAISAGFGVLVPGEKIEAYDRKMDENRMRDIARGIGPLTFAELIQKAGAGFVVGGALYQEIARVALRRFPELAPAVSFACGSYLQQRKQLGEFLRMNKSIQGVSDLPGQNELPGTEKSEHQWMAARCALPLRPTVEQKPCDVGLFSDDAAQIDLLDAIARKP